MNIPAHYSEKYRNHGIFVYLQLHIQNSPRIGRAVVPYANNLPAHPKFLRRACSPAAQIVRFGLDRRFGRAYPAQGRASLAHPFPRTP